MHASHVCRAAQPRWQNPQLVDSATLRSIFATAQQQRDDDRANFTFEEFVVACYLLAREGFNRDPSVSFSCHSKPF